FLQVCEQRRQRRQGLVQVVIQRRIGGHLADRALAAVHLGEQAVQRLGGGGEVAGELGQIGRQAVEPLDRPRAEDRVHVTHHALYRQQGGGGLLDHRPGPHLGEHVHAALRGDQGVVNVDR